MQKLGETAEFDCTVYGNTMPQISWYDLNGNEITGAEEKYEIIPSEDPDRLFTTKVLRVLNVVRLDNGTYTCNITNTINVASDDLRYGSGEYYLVVIGEFIKTPKDPCAWLK